MQIDLSKYLTPTDTVAVAVSGGSDSVALLHYMLIKSKEYHFKVIALNVEHGIRGKDSISDSLFVKNLCKEWGVKLLTYSVDSVKKAKEEKLSIEESARALRYNCFYEALEKGLCTLVATAHHKSDNAETVLFNLFRGTSPAGATGIPQVKGKIIRPFLSVSKEEIENYIKDNNLPFVTDKTNFDDSYTRNYIRLNVLPEIKKIFPEVENSIYRFSETAKLEQDYLDQVCESALKFDGEIVKISLPQHPAILSRATIKALKLLGVKKDWEKMHINAVLELTTAKNGTKIDVKNGVVAAKEYDVLTFYKQSDKIIDQKPFNLGTTIIGKKTVMIEKADMPKDLKSGLYLDLDKVPQTTVIRFKRDGDLFTKFGGGTKPLAEYFTDEKIPLRERNSIPIIADGNNVLAIVGIAISQKVKVEKSTANVIEIKAL
ncbi:MAG: tRNA lysidine(34) synthetase TilS [Clostridiales bacterium]|nr:tRNA lysidine(34) synthetase TilS [Clostridiales bacterium]